jgi:hypothetical protein
MNMIILLMVGGIFGVVVGLVSRSLKFGCAGLFIVPFAHYAYMDWWQSNQLETLRSTSGLDILFFLPFTCVGAMIGFLVGAGIRHAARRKTDDH